jgi:hypothetical protein
MNSIRPIGETARLWFAVAILVIAPGLAHAQTQKPKTPVVNKPANPPRPSTATKPAVSSKPAVTTGKAPSAWKPSFIHKPGSKTPSAPKSTSAPKPAFKSKQPATSTSAGTSKPAAGSKNVSASKPVPASKPAPRTASTGKPGATSPPVAGAHGATGNGGLTGTSKTPAGGESGLTAGNTSAPTSGTRGTTSSERKIPAGTAPEAKAPESRAPDTHAAENHAEPTPARTVTRPNGDRAEYNTAGKPTRLTTKSGDEARFDSTGHVRVIHSQDTTIRLGPYGGRTIVTERPDHTRIVSMGPRYGYVDRPIVRGGRPYLERTYVSDGHVYARAFPGYYYHGALYYHYVPAYYYAPAFYGWAVHPWHAPVVFAWNWGPWQGYYGYYFSPYPNYVSASLWLTDYIIAQELQAAFDAQQAANNSQPAVAPAPADNSQSAAPPGEISQGAPLSPEVKQSIAVEVTAQLNSENNSATSTAATTAGAPAPTGDVLPEALSPTNRTFIADISLDEDLDDGATCSVGPGDVLTRVDNSPDADQKVKVVIRSSAKGDCAAGTRVAVSAADLQDMSNHMREKVDDGVGQLAQDQGKNGMPGAPAAKPVQVADAQATPDLDAQHQLQQQQHTADAAQRNVQKSVNQLGEASSLIFDDEVPSAAQTIADGEDARVSTIVNLPTDLAAGLPSGDRSEFFTRLRIPGTANYPF